MKKAACLLPLCLLVLGGCAQTVDTQSVWETQLPETGVELTVSNCTVLSDEPVYYATDRVDTEYWTEKAAVQTEGVPVITLQGIQPEQLELRFVENIDWLYLYYDKVMPQPDLDYIQTELADGSLQIRLDTVYNYEFIVTTPQGTDNLIVTCSRDDL